MGPDGSERWRERFKDIVGQGHTYYSQSPQGRTHAEQPPQLEGSSDVPLYDISMVVEILGVRQLTLWTWEQQLGIPFGGRPDRGTGASRRYSERDLVALKWLCEQIVAGEPPYEAADRLIAAQPPHILGPQLPNSTHSVRIRTGPLTGPLTGNPREPGMEARRNPSTTRRLADLHAEVAAIEAASGAKPANSANTHTGAAAPAGAWDARSIAYTTQAGPFSGPLPPGADTAMIGVRPNNPAASSSASRELRSLGPQLLRAFAAFDTRAANAILRDTLAVCPVERACVGLLLPALQRMSDLRAKNALDAPEEQFAINYVRGFLFAVFHTTAERPDAPLVMVGCGPHEQYDVYALIQAAFWRRAGLRVIYLGADVKPGDLPQQMAHARPALLSLSVVSPQRVRALGKLAKDLHHHANYPAPRPLFAFSGPIFVRNAELQDKVSGVYLGDDIQAMTWHVKRLLGAEDSGAPTR